MYDKFEKMTVWQKARILVLEMWKITSGFPSEDLYTLVSQIRRSALSVSANIAEGFGRQHSLDKVKFYLNARGSLDETLSHLIIAKDIGRIDSKTHTRIENMIGEIKFELNKIIKTLRPKSGAQP